MTLCTQLRVVKRMKYYRCEAWGITDSSPVTYYEYEVLSQTPFSTCILADGRTRRILEHRRNGRDTVKRWARTTQALALESLHHRKIKQVKILSGRLAEALKELRRTEEELKDPSYRIKLLPAPAEVRTM